MVRFNNGQAKAEVLANADVGGVMVHLGTRNTRPAGPAKTIPWSSVAATTIELQPYPTVSDPRGVRSRFYGQADRSGKGGVHHGWLGGADKNRQEFGLATAGRARPVRCG